METVSARRGHVRRPLLGNQELPVVPPQTWTHHLGAADSVEPAGDSASATCPDVVLKLTGLTSDTGPPLLQPLPHRLGQRPIKGPLHPPHWPLHARARQNPTTCSQSCSAHSRTHANTCTCVFEARGPSGIARRARPARGPLRPREQPCPPPPSQAGLRPWGLGADSLGSKRSQE